jgi:hypothetical protein
MRKLEDKIFSMVIQTLSRAKLGANYWNARKVELNKLYREMDTTFNAWANVEVPQSYRRSLHLMQRRLKGLKGVVAKKGLIDLMNTNASTQIVSGLYTTAVESFVSASVGGKANLTNLFRQTQQMLVDESLINVAVAQGFEMGNLRQAKSMLSAVFQSREWAQVESKQLVRAGSKTFRPSYYAELVARTKFHQAQSQAAIMQAVNHGTDLVEISSHNTTTVICIPFEGNIYSISGTSNRFPPLTDLPPFHPNCLHLTFPVFEAALGLAA